MAWNNELWWDRSGGNSSFGSSWIKIKLFLLKNTGGWWWSVFSSTQRHFTSQDTQRHFTLNPLFIHSSVTHWGWCSYICSHSCREADSQFSPTASPTTTQHSYKPMWVKSWSRIWTANHLVFGQHVHPPNVKWLITHFTLAFTLALMCNEKSLTLLMRLDAQWGHHAGPLLCSYHHLLHLLALTSSLAFPLALTSAGGP